MTGNLRNNPSNLTPLRNNSTEMNISRSDVRMSNVGEEPMTSYLHVGSQGVYPLTRHIKREESDDEYIDVVSYFEADNSKAKNHEFHKGRFTGVEQSQGSSLRDVSEFEKGCNTRRNVCGDERDVNASFDHREEITVLNPERINKDFEVQHKKNHMSDYRKYQLLKQQLSGGVNKDSEEQLAKNHMSDYRNYQLLKQQLSERVNKDSEEPAKNHMSEYRKYQLLKKQLAAEPLDKVIVISRNLNNQIEKQLQTSTLNKQRTSLDPPQETTPSNESVPFTACCDFDHEYQPFQIHPELSGANHGQHRHSVEDITLRYRVLVFLWILLGERRLFKVGYPTQPIHVVLWRVVHTCCAVSGVKSAAAVPLPPDHDCEGDMLCFRDHVHRFLEICAPTRDHWKQFGWASLTVDAVVNKIYKQEILTPLLQHTLIIPVTIRMAMCKLASLEKSLVKVPERPSTRWRLIPRATAPATSRMYVTPSAAYREQGGRPMQEKKKRGRPLKVNRMPQDTSGKIERVMLWRFVLNLLEEPGNSACIHWLNRDEGIFRILNTDWLARIWGRRHGNPRMTYEKMARAMRTYYRSKVLQPVPRYKNLPRKLVYRFNPALVKRVTAK